MYSRWLQTRSCSVVDSGQAIACRAEAGLFPGLSGRGRDVVSLSWLLQTSQVDVVVLLPHQHWQILDGRGLPRWWTWAASVLDVVHVNFDLNRVLEDVEHDVIEAPSGQVEHPRQEVTSIDARDETENYHFDINADSPHVMCENGKNGSTFCQEIETNEIPTHLLIFAGAWVTLF